MNNDTPVGSVQRSEKELKKVADAIEREGGDVVQVRRLHKILFEQSYSIDKL